MLENDPLSKAIEPGDMPEDGMGAPRPGHAEQRDPIGQVLGGRFEVQEEIGAGAFAVTYRGHDLRLGRPVAIKVLRRTYAVNLTDVQRFEREARAAASVAQGNVVDVYDFGQHTDLLYMVMQYIEGEDLKHQIAREGPLPSRRAVEIALQVLAGLTAIHQAGIIHRDIKPQNVMIGRDGIARVTDFGIARVSVDVGLTTAGTTVGTASYMAPEQAQAGTLVRATDLYSVGIVLYEMLTTRLPFEAPTMIALMLAHIQTMPLPPSARAPVQHIPPALDAVVMRALAKRPEDRFADAPAMAGALVAAIGDSLSPEESRRPMMAVDADTIRTSHQPSPPMVNTWPPSPTRPAARQATPVVTSHRPVLPRTRVLPLALMLLLLLGGVVGGAAFLRYRDNGGDTAEDGRRGLVADLNPTPTAEGQEIAVPTNTPEPPPTKTPIPTPTDTPRPTVTRVPTETPEPPPTKTPEPLPTDPPIQSDVADGAAETDGLNLAGGNRVSSTVGQNASRTMTINFAASDWQGAYFQQTGNLQPWSGVYAQSTGYGEGTLSFVVDGEPSSETFNLTVDGMTSENWTELPISILINGQQVYSGNSPFPTWNGIDGQQPWSTVSVDLPTSVLLPGENTVTFVNRLDQGTFGRPPYILLAGGTLTVEIRDSGGAAAAPSTQR